MEMKYITLLTFIYFIFISQMCLVGGKHICWIVWEWMWHFLSWQDDTIEMKFMFKGNIYLTDS